MNQCIGRLWNQRILLYLTIYISEIDRERAWIAANITDFTIPHNFTITAPPPTPQQAKGPIPRHIQPPRK
jgi:hypothetical protein